MKIVYWSGTGNTEKMAQAVAEGAGAQAELKTVSEVKADELLQDAVFALGCPAMGAEELEEGEMEPFMTELEGKGLSGKKVLLFGSYDWGDGAWMQTWEERVTSAGGTLIGGSGIIANNEPDDEALEKLKEAGKQLAQG